MPSFFVQDGKNSGPKTLDELHELCRRGEIAESVNVRADGAAEWQPLSTILPTTSGPPPLRTPPPLRVASSPVSSPTVARKIRRLGALMSGQGGVVIAILLCGFFVLPFFRFAFAAAMPSQKWEYKIEAIPDYSSFTDRINDFGAEGWELVFARRASERNSDTMSYEMIFKRVKK